MFGKNFLLTILLDHRFTENSLHQRDSNRTQLFGPNFNNLPERASSPYDNDNNLDFSASKLSQLESQSDQHMGVMGEKIRALKSLSLKMGDEIRGSNQTLGQLGDTFDNASTKLKHTFSKMMVMAKNSRISLKTWLIIFFFVILLFFWVRIR